MTCQTRFIVLAMLSMLVCSCIPSDRGGSPSPPPVPDPPLTYTPTNTSSSLFNPDFSPSNSLQSGTPQLDRPFTRAERAEILNPVAKAEYDALKQKQAAIEAEIRELDNTRRGVDYEMMQFLSSAGAKMESGGKHTYGSGDLQSVYEPPDVFIRNKGWEREYAVNTIVEKQRELVQISQQIDQVVNESSKSCFPGATAILMSDGGIKRIADLEVGDSLTVYDIASDTLATAPIKQIFMADNNHYYRVNEQVSATAYERFLTRRGWLKIRDLTLQDEIFNGNGFEKVNSLDKTVADLTVYNLHVDLAHNFFVSDDGSSFLLVHNSGGGEGSEGGGGK